MSDAYFDTLLSLNPLSPYLIASAVAAKLEIPARRCRWWVKRHKWLSHGPLLDSEGNVAIAMTTCKRCHIDRFLVRSDIGGESVS